jgi:hypothetical protein
MPAIRHHELTEVDMHLPGRRELAIHGGKCAPCLWHPFNGYDFANDFSPSRND